MTAEEILGINPNNKKFIIEKMEEYYELKTKEKDEELNYYMDTVESLKKELSERDSIWIAVKDDKIESLKKENEELTKLKFTDIKGLLTKEMKQDGSFDGIVSYQGIFTGKVNMNLFTNSLQEYLSAKCSELQSQLTLSNDRAVRLENEVKELEMKIELMEGDAKEQTFLD